MLVRGPKFWQKKYHMRFITLFLNLDNGDYNCARNAAKDSLPRFYIFRGERIRDNYIKHYKVKT